MLSFSSPNHSNTKSRYLFPSLVHSHLPQPSPSRLTTRTHLPNPPHTTSHLNPNLTPPSPSPLPTIQKPVATTPHPTRPHHHARRPTPNRSPPPPLLPAPPFRNWDLAPLAPNPPRHAHSPPATVPATESLTEKKTYCPGILEAVTDVVGVGGGGVCDEEGW